MSPQPLAEIAVELMTQLAALPDEATRRSFLREHPELEHCAVALRLTDEAVRAAREDLARAENLAQVASWLADVLNDDFCRARAARTAGHLLALKGKYAEAVETYEQAFNLFTRLGQESEACITLSSSLQPLMYLSRYAEAFDRAQKAREIFKRLGDHLRLARLDANLANILHRQDRFQDALVLYERARQALESFGEHRDVAVVLGNMAVCCISVYDFPRALEAHRKAREYCEQHQMPLLAAQADYNIAYLYYLRGEYPRAIELYQATRVFCDRVGDAYHRSLCDLDQSELYLELNLAEEAGRLAQQAFASFEEHGMGYEAAKALAFLAMAASQQGRVFRALELFAKARERFLREQNWVWPALMDLYQALVLYHEGRAYEARRSCDAAVNFFTHSALAGKAAVAALLRAKLHMAAGDQAAAQYWCQNALARLEPAENRAQRYLCYFVRGELQELQNDALAAHQSYRSSLDALESLPSQGFAEELKIPFLKNKLAVYEALVSTGVGRGDEQGAAAHEELFAVMEKAKSRQLADLIAFRAHSLPAPAGTHSGLVEQVKSLREELNWYYRQIDVEELRQGVHSEETVERLRQRTHEHETRLLKSLTEMQSSDEEFLSLQSAATIPLETIRKALPPEALLLEYFLARDTIYACVLDRARLRLRAVSPASRVRSLLRELQGQFSKFRLGADYERKFQQPMLEASLRCLNLLDQELIEPVRDWLEARRWIIVPDGFLHYVPFHALYDGARHLAEDFVISYASSASLYYLCATKKVATEERSLVLEVTDSLEDPRTSEAQAVAGLLPEAQILLGDAASEEALRDQGPRARYVHLATTGAYRQDNPLFSTLRLGRSQLSLFDLYQLRLPCELVTLSGCGPGLNPAGNGEELFALVRGLFYAGAQCVLAGTWNVPRPASTELLVSFYRRMNETPDKAVALQGAMLEVRQSYPHPHFWAGFALNGQPLRS